ncbi:hypothetical protein GQ53DRAFT_820170 [Thozetella sp. PMI_491]|nr:hypothetical protein GQ53DRAFT_820170 [Thozetella sp. PMI_491]
MYFPSAFVLLALAYQTIASPTGLEAVVKRGPPPPAGESVHLVNCSGGTRISLVVYCSSDSVCFGNNNIPSNDICIKSLGSWFTWETSGGCTFPSGVSFTWNIASGSNTKPYGTDVGSGSNGFNDMVCKKDSDVYMFSYDGEACDTIYWCQDSN